MNINNNVLIIVYYNNTLTIQQQKTIETSNLKFKLGVKLVKSIESLWCKLYFFQRILPILCGKTREILNDINRIFIKDFP